MKASPSEEAFSFNLNVDLTPNMTIDISFKTRTHDACIQFLDDKIGTLKHEMNDLVSSAANDSKSTAGDKHETARAMMQQEQRRLGEQLREAEMQRGILARLKNEGSWTIIAEGSLVVTDKSLFYISVPIGKITLEKTDIFVISSLSPLAKKLKGKSKGDKVEQATANYVIQDIL